MSSFAEGLIYGIVKQEFPDMNTCLSDATLLEKDVLDGIQNFELGTFEGTRKALESFGLAVK